MKKTIQLLVMICTALGIGMGAGSSSAWAADFKVIANESVSDNSISKDALSAIYMGSSTTWPSGKSVKACQLKNGTAVTKAFLKSVGIRPKSFKRHWRKMLFSGNGVPPAVLGSDAEMLEFVQNNEGSVGFVSAGAEVSGVKEITVN